VDGVGAELEEVDGDVMARDWWWADQADAEVVVGEEEMAVVGTGRCRACQFCRRQRRTKWPCWDTTALGLVCARNC
jgi:hypothetical protein